ncbi:MAG: AAA family ATPase, partial [Chloroflexi bacterium]|nr:AAA family ATPase [Chloroflexota bacterium]
MNLTPLPHHTRRIYLLGQLRIETERKPIALRGGKIRGLFAYLVLYPRRQHSREFLADLLWPDAPFGRARRNFSDALYRLRQRLGPDWLLVERESVGLNVTAALWTDVWAFEEGVKNRETAALTQAVALYADDLLPEIYDDWILERRLALREAYLNSLLRLGQTFERQNEPETAHNYFHRLAHADPLREEAHRGLMRALASQGRLPDALTAYDNLERLLSVELEAPPNPESQALAEQLRGELALAQKASALPRQQLVERPFVGRIQERAAILTAVEAAAAGQGGVIAIEGEAGMGKSRLLQEIQPSAQWRNVALALGQAVARPSASPYAPLRRALADTLTSPRAAQLETVLPPETLAACSPLHPPWRDLAALPDLPPERSRQRFHRAFVAVWVALADFAPHLLILDDLHWADAALWDALDALVAALRQRRLLLILAYRRLDIERAAAWELLQKWERESHLAVISLKPLTENDIAQLLPPNLQAEAPRVLASAGGSPFLISEMLIALADGHTPYRRTAVDRAAALPPPARAALETAAVLGREIPYRLWARITNLPPITLAQVSETLVKHYLLTPTPVGYAFVHDLIQNAVYKNIKPTHRVRLHQRAADALAAQDAENHPARAFHLDRANAVTEAAVMYRQAAAQEQAEYAFASAQNAFDRALTLMPPTPTIERMETLLALAQVCQVTGDRERQKTTLDEALQSVAQLGNDALRLQTLIQIGEFAATTSAQAEATTYLNEALSLAQATADQSAQMETLLVLGNLAIRYGQYKEAQTHLETALALAQKLGKRRQEGRALDGLGYVMMHIGNDAQLTISYFEQALAVQRAAGDKFGESRTLSNLLGACQNMGAWDKVLAMVDEVLAAQEAVSYRLGTAVARQAQGLAACMLGDFSAAQQALALARNGFNEVGVQLGVGIAT